MAVVTAASLCNPHWGESVSIGQNNTLKMSIVCQGLDKQAARAMGTFFRVDHVKTDRI